jgi:N-acetyl-alpha-D-muramate 1-phosphate uridylyltransferase
MQAVILAGGLGTRLRPLTFSVPKPMVKINDKPFLEYELRLLKKNGFEEFVFCVEYKSEVIERHFGTGEMFGVSIIYSRDGDKQLGPAGALKKASSLLKKEFIVTYGDAFLQMDYRGFVETFHESGKLGMMAVFENHNEFGKSDLLVEDGMITRYNKSGNDPEIIWINFGATMLKKEALDLISPGIEVGEEQFYNSLIARRELAAFVTKERFYEIGTVQGLHEFENFLAKNPNYHND